MVDMSQRVTAHGGHPAIRAALSSCLGRVPKNVGGHFWLSLVFEKEKHWTLRGKCSGNLSP